MNNEIWTYIGYAVAFFGICILLSPVVNLLDRISLVISSLTPIPDDIYAIRLYWFFVKNQKLLKEVEDKIKNGEKADFILPLGKQSDDNDDDGELVKHEKDKTILS